MKRMNMNEFNCEIFKEFNKNWALLTAGDMDNRNTMTVSWGFMGTLWNKNCVVVFVRPQRHTFHLMEESAYFTLSFMGEEYRKEMVFMGRNSGRDVDKYKETGLIPVYDGDTFSSYIKNSKYVMKCKTLYSDFLNEENFFDKELLHHYDINLKDYHKFYIAEVVSLLVSEDEA